ncbi:MAG: endonuclease/exonuclease/phosphatase family protein [Pirellulaceae bacterium]|nr:endonuclease/exonuclease/phosphatase family protein [Pirellulaceae bacterium]
MRHLPRTLALALVVYFTHTVPCCYSDDGLKDGRLRVISYNVQFLPGPGAIANKRGKPDYRAQTIGQKMADYDIVGLCELFEDKPRDQVVAELQKSWKQEVNLIASPKVQPNRFTGGLAIMSRMPFLATNVHTYTQSSSPEKYGFLADGFATKGIVHARIALTSQKSEDQSVDVFMTHLEARESAIRPSQYLEFAEFVRRHASPQRPALLMGDFNTRGDTAEMENAQSAYNLMIGNFRSAQPDSQLIDLWPAVGRGAGGTSDQIKPDGGRRIDYIFLINPQAKHQQLEPLEATVNRFLDPRVEALSDHSAVECTLVWKQP